MFCRLRHAAFGEGGCYYGIPMALAFTGKAVRKRIALWTETMQEQPQILGIRP